MSDGSSIEWTQATWNPVTGCTKVSPGCAHCLDAETPVLFADMAWRPMGSVQVGDLLAGFDEWPDGAYRRTRPATVEAVWWSRQPVRRLVTSRSEVRASADHRWLRKTPSAWVPTSRLKPARGLRGIGQAVGPVLDEDYRAGYIAGMTLGDGTFRYEVGQRSDKLGFPQAYWRVALADEEPLGRLISFLASFGVEAHTRPFSGGHPGGKPMQKVEVRSLTRLGILERVVNTERPTLDWSRGWLAGIFDAEGSHGRNLRISQKDRGVLQRVRDLGARLGLRFEVEDFDRVAGTARLGGDMSDRFKFFGECQPAISRKYSALWGRVLETRQDPVVAVKDDGIGDLVDIQTSTGTFFAAGLATHNCYAETFAERFRGVPGHPYEGGFDLALRPDRMELPLTWKRSRLIFVNSMSDLFHQDVPDDYVIQVFETMRAADWHTFQVLTKRPERAAALAPLFGPWPEHVWMGTSVENQRWTTRVEDLRRIPAAVRFLSCEPLLGPLDLDLTDIHWVIVGGESGPKARPMKGEWAEHIRAQCEEANVPFFFKQWGAFDCQGRRVGKGRAGRELGGKTWNGMPKGGCASSLSPPAPALVPSAP